MVSSVICALYDTDIDCIGLFLLISQRLLTPVLEPYAPQDTVR